MMKKVKEGIFLKLTFSTQKKLYESHSDLLFLPERKKIEKVTNLIDNLQDKNEYVVKV